MQARRGLVDGSVLLECLQGFEAVRHLAQRPAEVGLALWFHDAVHDVQRFAQYEQQIREEYAFVPEDLFRTKRKEVLQSFAVRPRLYGTDHFHAMLEARARTNLARAMA